MYICEVNYILTFKSRSYEKQITFFSPSQDVYKRQEKYRFLENNGFLSSSGSIMKLARKSCNFTVKGEKGAFRTEHRRCVRCG